MENNQSIIVLSNIEWYLAMWNQIIFIREYETSFSPIKCRGENCNTSADCCAVLKGINVAGID